MSDDAEQVERVARAIAPGVWNLLDLFKGERSKLDDWIRGELDMSISAAKRAIEAMQPDKGIPIHPTSLAEKGIPGLATREVEGE